MKVRTDTNDYKVANVQSHGHFRVADTSFMQQLLSDFYSDRIAAVLRELGTNAFEAHYKDGHNEPFEVHLPTWSEPHFKIRDFGTGLSLEQLQELYTVYGLSDKRESDDYTGCFGLGSKSPFAYTSMFTVESHFNGTKYTVVCSKDDKGQFVFDVLDECATTEGNGLAISFNVNSDDIQSFRQKAGEVYKWFKVKPKSNVNIQYETYEVKLKDGNWEIVDQIDENLLVMGQVAYKIESDFFKKPEHQKILSYCDVILYAELDSGIDIPPQRESLKYTGDTVRIIESYLDEIYSYLVKFSNEFAKDATCKWDAQVYAEELYKGKYSFVKGVTGAKVVYNGEELPYYSDIETYRPKVDVDVRQYTYDGHMGREQRKDVSIRHIKDIAIIVYNSNGGFAAARRYVEDNKDTTAYVLQHDDPSKIDAFIDKIEYPRERILYTENLPKLEREKKERIVRERHMVPVYAYLVSNQYFSKVTYDIDINNKSGYYCPLYRGKIKDIEPTSLHEVLKDIVVVGVIQNRTKKFEDSPNWKHVAIAIKEKLTELEQDEDIKDFAGCIVDRKLLSLVQHGTNVKPVSKIYKAVQEVKRYYASQAKITQFNNLCDHYRTITGETFPFKNTPVNLGIEELPMLKYLSWSNYKDKAVEDYINQE